MKLVVIDDHRLFRDGLSALFESRGIEVLAGLDSGVDCLEKIKDIDPDLLLLDLRMPDMDGLQVLKKIRKKDTKIPVVMLTTSDDEADLIECLKNGAQGYLLKDMEPDALVGALDDILSGNTVVAKGLTNVLAKAIKGDVPNKKAKKSAALFEELTPREAEILTYLGDGQSNKSIANALSISDGTVKLHVKSILRKLKVHSRVEAAIMAVKNGVKRPAKKKS
jgi:two-component system, NarL family, nitrate/nitrite response regulator NarL